MYDVIPSAFLYKFKFVELLDFNVIRVHGDDVYTDWGWNKK